MLRWSRRRRLARRLALSRWLALALLPLRRQGKQQGQLPEGQLAEGQLAERMRMQLWLSSSLSLLQQVALLEWSSLLSLVPLEVGALVHQLVPLAREPSQLLGPLPLVLALAC